MATDELLFGPRLKLERANKHIADLHTLIVAFKKSDFARIAAKRDPQTREAVYYVADIKSVPADASLIAADALANLRSALDHLALQLWVAGGKSAGSERSVSFPIFDSPANYSAKKAGKVQGFPPRAIEFIDAIEPYKGGKGHILWVLDDLNNVAKHRLLLTVGAALTSVDVSHVLNRALTDVGWPALFDFPHHVPATGCKCPLQAGDVLFIDAPDAEFNEKAEFTIEVSFGEPQVPEGDPVMKTLLEMAQFVQGVLHMLGKFF